MSTEENLDALCDRLNEEMRLTEAYFVGLNIGERAQVSFEDGTLLVYGKTGDVWGLYVEGAGDTKKLTSASKRKRIESVSLMPALREALLAAQNKRMVELREAVQKLREFRSDADVAPVRAEPAKANRDRCCAECYSSQGGCDSHGTCPCHDDKVVELDFRSYGSAAAVLNAVENKGSINVTGDIIRIEDGLLVIRYPLGDKETRRVVSAKRADPLRIELYMEGNQS